MVPFWRRRLLAVTLPVLASATLVAIALGVMLTQLARMPTHELDLEAVWASLALAAPHPLVVLLVTLLLARGVRRDALSIGYITAAALLCIWVFTASFFLAVGIGTGLGANPNRSPSLLLFGLLAALAIPGFGLHLAGGVFPRTARAARLCSIAAAAGGLGLSLAVPLFVVRLSLRDPDLPTAGDRHAVAGLSLAIYAGLALCSAGLASAVACRQLALRHAPYHARHCHHCGYDLLGTERPVCPECDHPISPEQSQHLRNEPLA